MTSRPTRKSSTDTADVIIIGAGVMGCSVAYELARAGLSVRVLERSVPGAEASSAAAGILGPAMECHDLGDGPGLRLGLVSREMHAQLANVMRADLGLDTGFVRSGLLRVAFEPARHPVNVTGTPPGMVTRADDAALAAHHSLLHRAGVDAELLSGADAREMEPALSPAVTSALRTPSAAQVRPRRLLRALSLAAEKHGAVFQSDAIVREVLMSSGRVKGVDVDGQTLFAPNVVVAAGSWTNLVPGLSLPANTIFPVKGQVLQTRTRPPVLRHIVFGAGGYLVPRPDGELLVGATTEAVGFERGVTLGGLAQLVETARSVVPRLTSARVDDHWAGFRPGTPDHLPLIGDLRSVASGLYLASGHYRNGILLAPVTGHLIAAAILGRDVDSAIDARDVTAVSPARLEAARD